MTIDYAEISTMPKAQTRHIFIDAGPGSLVVSGEDMAVIGRTNRPDLAALNWNDIAGEHRRYVVAGGEPAELSALAEEARGFFNGGPIADLSAEGARLCLALAGRFGAFRAGPVRKCRTFPAECAAV